MKVSWRLPALIALAASLNAQIAVTPERGAPSPGTNRPISVVRAALTGDVDARKIRGGDALQAMVTQDVKVGEAMIAKGTKILGHAGQVRRRAKSGEDSVVEMVFDKAVLKDGSELPILVSVQAIGPKLSSAVDDTSTTSTSAEATDRSGCVPGMDALRSTMGQAADSARRDHRLSLTSVGIIELPELALSRYAQTDTLVSQVSSAKRDVRLEAGSQLILRVGLR